MKTKLLQDGMDTPLSISCYHRCSKKLRIQYVTEQHLKNKNDPSPQIDWTLPTDRKFIALSKNDLFGDSSSFIVESKDDITIDTSPLVDDTKMNGDFKSPKRKQSRYSMRQSKSDKIIDDAMQKIYAEQAKINRECELQYQKFAEFQELQKLDKEMRKRKQMTDKEKQELDQRELEKQKERKKKLDKLDGEKALELDKIKEIIAMEFSKRDNELKSKQSEIEKLRKELEEKIKYQDELTNKLRDKSCQNEEIIDDLRDKICDLQHNQIELIEEEDIEGNKEEIAVTEHKIEDIEVEQTEIAKEIDDNIEIHDKLENKVHKLNRDEVVVIEEQKSLEEEKKRELRKRYKWAYKDFDIRRANIMIESEIEFKVIRERRSLIDREELMNNVKMKMKKQFKEALMKLRLQLAAGKKKLPFTKINNTFFGEGSIAFSSTPNGELCACVGINGVFHVIDIRSGKDVYFQSLKSVIAGYAENEDKMRVLDIKWDKDSSLVGILLSDCQSIGIWNSLTKEFYEFCVEDNEDIISSFAWSNNQLMLGMHSGDIHIKNMNDSKNQMTTMPNKMRGKIDICRWSVDDKFGIVVNETHIAIVNNIGLSVERIGSKETVIDIQCGIIKRRNVLTVISSNNLIFHGINDETKRKLISFDGVYGKMISHHWCGDKIILSFEQGHLVVLDVLTYQNKHLKCAQIIKGMHAIYLPDFGYMIGIIDGKCIRFLKFSYVKDEESKWELINEVDYLDAEWMDVNGIPTKIIITQNGKHSIVVTNNGTMIIFQLML